MPQPTTSTPEQHRKADKTIELPAHASPALPPLLSPQVRPPTHTFDLAHHDSNGPPPPSIISPAFTPPLTPSISGRETPLLQRPSTSVPVDTSLSTTPGPALLERLPVVECQVRARIPTTTGQEMWLHLYTNDHDNKEHLAIVFGSTIRSASLDRPREGETEFDRMVRGAYVGRLWPGRVSSRVEQQAKPGDSSTTITNTEIPAANTSSEEAAPGEDASEPTDDPTSHIPPLVRIHSECYTGETVWSARCDCGEQLDEAARLMSLRDTVSPTGGVIVYLRQEGRGIGLGEKLKAYNLQDLGNDTYEANLLLRHPADARSYGLATSILVDLGLGREGGDGGTVGVGKEVDAVVADSGSRGARGIRLLTNNPDKVRAVEGPNREVVVRERVAMVPLAWKTGGKMGVKGEEVEKYLSTKIEKFKHMLEMQ